MKDDQQARLDSNKSNLSASAEENVCSNEQFKICKLLTIHLINPFKNLRNNFLNYDNYWHAHRDNPLRCMTTSDNCFNYVLYAKDCSYRYSRHILYK